MSGLVFITPDYLNCVSASWPIGKTRKFDVHACEACMNIKFPALLDIWYAVRHTTKTVRGLLLI
jgi:hypothetical protein